MKKIILGLFTLLTLIQFSCKHSRTSDTIGPDACPTDNFAVTTSLLCNGSNSLTSLSLVTTYATFTAAFNESISYKLTITGSPSGAIYTLDGQGSALNQKWYGNSSNGKYFKQNDLLSIQLTNLCKTEPLGTLSGITISTIIGYNKFGLKALNYDESPAIYPAHPYGFADQTASPKYGSSTLMTPASLGYEASPQGGNYYKFRADSVPPGNPSNPANAQGKHITWYFGGADFASVPPLADTLGHDPTRVYLNFFAKGQANSQCQMIISETPIANGGALTRKYLANVGSEWTLYSVKLSDIGVIDPSSIGTLSFNLGAVLYQDTSAEVDLDLVIFTLDKPF